VNARGALTFEVVLTSLSDVVLTSLSPLSSLPPSLCVHSIVCRATRMPHLQTYADADLPAVVVPR
jgi:hypothetical protein